MSQGRAALEAVNASMGLGMDEQDLDMYLALFRDKIKRDPTSVELYDLGQGNSEHSRHWFFRAKMVVDGKVNGEG